MITRWTVPTEQPTSAAIAEMERPDVRNRVIPACRLALERMIVQAQDLELRASLGVSAQSRRHRAQVARKWALEIKGDGDVTDNDREREPSAEIQER